jgi:hypothetical protein
MWLQNGDRAYIEFVMDFVQKITMYRRHIDWCASNELIFSKFAQNIRPSLEYISIGWQYVRF